MSKKHLILLVVISVLGLTAWFGFHSRSNVEVAEIDTDNNKVTSPLPNLQEMPDVSLQDLEGNKISLADYLGKPLVINSWAAWCPFCKNELPDFAKLQQEFADQIAVIAVDRQEDLSQVKEFASKVNILDKITILLDPSDEFYKKIGGFTMPETIFVDSKGIVRIHKRGPINFEEMKENVKTLLEFDKQ